MFDNKSPQLYAFVAYLFEVGFMELKGRDVISIYDLTREEVVQLLQLGKKMHDAEKNGKRHNWSNSLRDTTLASLF